MSNNDLKRDDGDFDQFANGGSLQLQYRTEDRIEEVEDEHEQNTFSDQDEEEFAENNGREQQVQEEESK